MFTLNICTYIHYSYVSKCIQILNGTGCIARKKFWSSVNSLHNIMLHCPIAPSRGVFLPHIVNCFVT